MKTIGLKTITITAFALMMGAFTSCEKEETLLLNEDTTSIKVSEEPVTLSSRTYLASVSRYYAGGANTLHTYRVANLGTGIGTRESIPFKLGIFDREITPNPPGGTAVLYLLLSPGNRDFLLTRNSTERNNLLRSGWRNLSEYNTYDSYGDNVISQAAYIHTSGGGGRVALYRFYGVSNSDHLFTTNYQEGIAAGYNYEGVTGWVYR